MKYRVFVQADGAPADGTWVGLYAAREVLANDEDEAAGRAKAMIEAAWDDATHGPLRAVEAVAVWRTPLLSFRRCPAGGHTFYNDDLDAQQEALRLEAVVSGLPRRLLKRLLADFG